MTLSVCLIVKDEQDVIARCLGCVEKFADEIIIVDTGSTDRTVEEARKFTDKIYYFEWCDDFSAARNFAFEKATGDFVMWLDADDVVDDESCRKIRELMRDTAGFDMVHLPYVAAQDDGVPTFVYYRERIMRRSKNYRFEGAVHEAVTPHGRTLYSDAKIVHKKLKDGNPLRNLNIMQKRIARGISLNEREKFYYGRELFFCGMMRESISVLEDFLTGDGWVENKIEACLNLYKAYIALGDEKSAFLSLLKGFLYAPPRSEACCILGERAMRQNDVNSAIYWYQLALSSKDDVACGGFVNVDFSGFIPNIQLCVLYDRLGDYNKAFAFNEAAGKIKPHNPNYLSNKKYFKELRGINPDDN